MLQKLTLAKVSGSSAELIARQLRVWCADRCAHDLERPFPPAVRRGVDALALLLREHCAKPPVIYFTEWIDPWSMGDTLKAAFPPQDDLLDL
jgi:hypothetical protein